MFKKKKNTKIPFRTFTMRTYHTPSTESTHPHSLPIPNIRKFHPDNFLSPLKKFLCGTDSCLVAYLNAIILTSSSQRLIVIYHPYAHNLHSLPPPLLSLIINILTVFLHLVWLSIAWIFCFFVLNCLVFSVNPGLISHKRR